MRYSLFGIRSDWRLLVFMATLMPPLFMRIWTAPPSPPQLKSVGFEVVSIRPSAPGSVQGVSFSHGPDGYHARGQSMFETVMVAYYPLDHRYWRESLKQYPKWFDEMYDIDAKVSAADVPAWKAQDRGNSMLKAMLQSALEERCRLELHQELRVGKVFDLVMAKKRTGALVTSDVSHVAPQNAYKFLGSSGGFIPSSGDLRFFNTSMEELAAFITGSADRPIFDATGLAGRYDFTLPRIATDDSDSAGPSAALEAPVRYRLQELGLKIQPGTRPLVTLIIDHVEKPSPN